MNEISPNFGEIISGSSAFVLLKNEVSKLTNSNIVLASAYVKIRALEDLSNGNIDPTNNVRILARWKPDDLLTGASDLACYQYAKSKGWPFFIKPYFHGKAYLAGNRSVFIGSSNLTLSGFSIGLHGNDEGMVQVSASLNNINAVERFFDGATLVTEELFSKLENWIQLNQDSKKANSFSQWPNEIASMLNRVIDLERIVCSDCFWTDGSWLKNLNKQDINEQVILDINHDLSLLGFQSIERFKAASPLNIDTALNDTGIVRWLQFLISKKDTKEIYFGELTAALHNALVDDPKPYRQDVKKFVGNLYSWLEFFSKDFISDCPNHSQRLRLVLT